MFWRIETEWIEEGRHSGFRLYVSEADDPDAFFCHGCAPQLAIVGLERRWNGWHEGPLVLNLGHFGSWGRLPGYQFTQIAGEPYFLIHAGFSGGGTTEMTHDFYSLNSIAGEDSLSQPMLTIHTTERAEGGFGWSRLPTEVQQTIEEADCEISSGLLGYYEAYERLEIDSESGLVACQMVQRKCGVEPPCDIDGIREDGVVWELEDTPIERIQLPCEPRTVRISTGIEHWPE
jgi:hypothetical protein